MSESFETFKEIVGDKFHQDGYVERCFYGIVRQSCKDKDEEIVQAFALLKEHRPELARLIALGSLSSCIAYD